MNSPLSHHTRHRLACLCLAGAASCAALARSLPAQAPRADTARVKHPVGQEDSAAARGDSILGRVRLGRVVVKAEKTNGYAPRRNSSATRTDTPLRDVPQSVSIVGRTQIEDQGMRSMQDVVRYVPGITMGLGEGHRDSPTIRGIASTADFFVDGVRDDAQFFRDLYNVERVEALKGANALSFGRGGGGGVINRVMKEPQWSPTRSLGLETGSFSYQRATLDVGDSFGSKVAMRFNGMIEGSGSFRDQVDLSRRGINPTLTLLAKSTMIRVGYEHFRDRRIVDRGVPSFAGAPSSSPIAAFFGDPAVSRSRADVDAASIAIERALPLGITVRHQTRLARYDKFYQNVFPGALDLTGATVSLSGYNAATDRVNRFHQTDATWRRRTGWLGHTLHVGTELGRQSTDNFRNTAYFNGAATTLSAPFARPTVAVPVSFRQSASDADNRTIADVTALFVQDQLAIGERWQAIAGVRWDRFALENVNNRTSQRFSRTDRMISPRAGLVFRATKPLSVYASYSVSALPASGEQFGSLTATTQTLRPERFFNRELGLKWEPNSLVALNVAGYRLDRTNTTAPSSNDPAVLVQTGRQRSTGVELGVSGNVTSTWQVAGGFAAQRATIVSTTTAAREGTTVPLVPNRNWSLWNRWQPARAIGMGVGVVRQGATYAAVDNAVTLPPFTRLDAAAYFTLLPWLRGQVNIENLLDARYYPTSYGNNNILPGSPRSVRVMLTTR